MIPFYIKLAITIKPHTVTPTPGAAKFDTSFLHANAKYSTDMPMSLGPRLAVQKYRFHDSYCKPMKTVQQIGRPMIYIQCIYNSNYILKTNLNTKVCFAF